MKQHFYSVYGLSICSEIDLPELTPAFSGDADVEIVLGEVPEHLPEVSGSGVLYEATKNDFLFKFRNIARYRVQEGNLITIQPDSSARPEEVRLFLLGSSMGALLHQRGLLAIHGSAVHNGKNTCIITGKSGVGKSSLAAGLLELGYTLVADDISVIGTLENGGFFVHPGIPSLKLWKDVLLHLKQEDDLEKVRPQLEKYRKPVAMSELKAGIPVEKIAYLDLNNSADFRHSEILGVEKFNIIRNNSYRFQYIDKLHQTTNHFTRTSAFASQVRMFRVERPPFPLRVLELAEYFAREILNR